MPGLSVNTTRSPIGLDFLPTTFPGFFEYLRGGELLNKIPRRR